jgi:hypothetical protein
MIDHAPHDLQRLQAAIDQQNIAQVHAFFEAADVVACNDLLLEASQRYDFHTEIIDTPPSHGQRLFLARKLAQLMYDEDSTDALGKILRRYGMDFLRIGAFRHDVKRLLIAAFQLNKFDVKTAFCTWNHLVLVGMYGQTEAARRVRAQLLQDHRAWRINQKVEESTGKSARQHLVDNLLDARDTPTPPATPPSARYPGAVLPRTPSWMTLETGETPRRKFGHTVGVI